MKNISHWTASKIRVHYSLPELTCVLFLHPLQSKVLLQRLAVAIMPQHLHTWILYGSDTSNNLSCKNWAAPCAIWQSRSISPKCKPPSLLKNTSTKIKKCTSKSSTDLFTNLLVQDLSIALNSHFRLSRNSFLYNIIVHHNVSTVLPIQPSVFFKGWLRQSFL